MGYSHEQLVKMMGKEKADQVFSQSGKDIPKKLSETEKEYLKMCESAHGKKLHQYLQSIGIAHTHIGNEAGQSGSKNIIIMMAKKKAQGVSVGFPDYLIFIPYSNGFVELRIELKKARGLKGGLNGSKVSDEQIEWMKRTSQTIGSFSYICHGYKEAIEVVDFFVQTFRRCEDDDVMGTWNRYVDYIEEHGDFSFTRDAFAKDIG